MARKFDVSFKNTTKENMMFDYFNNLEDRSAEIKNILYPWYVENILGKQKDVDLENKSNNNDLDIDITNFQEIKYEKIIRKNIKQAI